MWWRDMLQCQLKGKVECCKHEHLTPPRTCSKSVVALGGDVLLYGDGDNTYVDGIFGLR